MHRAANISSHVVTSAVSGTINDTTTLRDGVVMPMFGLGVFLSEPGDETRVASELALANDYIMIDTAQGYDNEQSVGEAIKDKDRSSLFIVTKLAGDNHGAEGVRTSIRESLEKLGTDYVDLFLIHNPRGLDVLETWEAMLEVKAQGLARAVGVSNFGVSHLKALKAAGLEMPEVNQVELHCWHQQTLLVKYHATENIATMGYCPMARARKFGDPLIAALAEKYGKTEAQIMIRWSLQLGYITIPKSVNEPRIIQNADIFDFAISANDMAAIAELDEDFHASSASSSQHMALGDIL